MAYTIIKTNGTVLTTIADGTVNNTSSSLELPGRNYAGYGVVMDTNLVHLLENFADSTVPANPIRGQLWYNTSTQSLYVCPADGETNISNWYKLLSSANFDLTNLTLPGDLLANNAFITNDVNANVVNTNYLNVDEDSSLLGTSTISDIIANTITSGVSTGTINGNWNLNGNIAPTGIKTDNYYYANGVPVDFQQPAGSNYQVQYSLDGNFGSSSNLSFDPTSNVLTVSGNVNATQFIGNGIGITNVPAANLSGTIASAVQSTITQLGTLSTVTITGTATIGNISSSGNISATRLTGSLTTAAQPNVTSLGTLTGLVSNGNVNFTNTSNVLLGSVSNLKITGGSSSYILVTDGTGNLSFTAQSSLAAGAAGSSTQIQYNNGGVMNASSNLTFNSTTNILTVNGNINSANANLGNLASANYFIGSGYNLSDIYGPNILGDAPSALVAGAVYTNAQPNITSVGTLTSLSVLGNITAGNASLGNAVTANYFIGSGANLTNINGSNVSIVPNATFATSAASATSATTAGTVTTAAQPNITSLGTLSALGVTGAIVSGANISANYFIGNGSLLTGVAASNTAVTVTANSQPNITSLGTLVNLTVTGNITSSDANLGNAVTANYFIGSGAYLTNISGSNVSIVPNATFATTSGTANTIAGANVTGTVANATYAVTSGSANTATTAVTVTAAAQPNITSLGTLVSLTVTGNITSGNASLGGTATAGNFVGNGSKLTNINGANVTGVVGNATFAVTATNGMPSGGIIMWSGAIVAIPAGWYLCDGTNGTPDLRNRFVVGAGTLYSVNDTGGSKDSALITHQHSYSGVSVANGTHTHTVTDSGHSHVYPGDDQLSYAAGYYPNVWPGTTLGGFPYDARSSFGGGAQMWYTSSNTTGITLSTVANHTHSYSGTTTNSGTTNGINQNLPPYYALCFIMKA